MLRIAKEPARPWLVSLHRPRVWILIGGLVAVGAWIYAPALHGSSLWDDDSQIFHNPALRSAAGLAAAWTAPATPDYLPLLGTVEWLQWQRWGARVTGYHATNIALHLLSALLLWRLLARLGARGGAWAAWLFAVHPLAVESVAWMAELKNALSLPFLLLALTAYVDHDRDGRGRSNATALACFLAALLGKSSVVILPAVLLLHALWRHGKIRREDLCASAPFFALAGLLGAVAVWFQGRYAIGELRPLVPGLAARGAQTGSSLGFYLGRILWPDPLMPVYPGFTHAGLRSVFTWAAVALAATAGWHSRNSTVRAAWFGAGCVVLSLVPVLGLVPMSYLRIAPVADHLAYIALAGGCGLAGAGLGALGLLPSRGRRWVAGGSGAMLVALLAMAARGQAAHYRSGVAFWSYAAEKNPSSWVVQENLGSALLGAGDPAAAFPHFASARLAHPTSAEVAVNGADALLHLGRVSEAVAWAEEGVRLEPGFSSAQYNLGNALVRAGRLEEAVRHFRIAVRLEPGAVEIRYNLGTALAQLGRGPEAIEQLGAVVRAEPDNYAARMNLANVLAAGGRMAEALPQLAAAVQLRPADPDAHAGLGEVLEALDRAPDAVAEFEEALRLRPGDPAVTAALADARRRGPGR
jgi:tetratricopeptide (TPR) repeat protein